MQQQCLLSFNEDFKAFLKPSPSFWGTYKLILLQIACNQQGSHSFVLEHSTQTLSVYPILNTIRCLHVKVLESSVVPCEIQEGGRGKQVFCANAVLCQSGIRGSQSHPNKTNHLKPSRPCQKAGWGSFLPFKEQSRNTPACPNVALKNVIRSNEDWSFIEKHLGTRWKVADQEEINTDYK